MSVQYMTHLTHWIIIDPVELARKIDTPGPGHYRAIGISPTGDYKLSNVP